MNKKNSALFILLVAVPACNTSMRRKTTTPVEPVFCTQRVCNPDNEIVVEEIVEPSVSIKPDNRLIVDEDLEGFVLEEDGANPFTAPTEQAERPDTQDVMLVKPEVNAEVNDDSWIDQRLEQMQEHRLRTIYFGYDDYKLRPDQEGVLEYNTRKVAELARKGHKIVVEGHACLHGKSGVYNMHLSEERARSVAKYLADHDVAKEQLTVVGRGNEMCIVPEGDIDQQAPNRRVELYVLDETSKVA